MSESWYGGAWWMLGALGFRATGPVGSYERDVRQAARDLAEVASALPAGALLLAAGLVLALAAVVAWQRRRIREFSDLEARYRCFSDATVEGLIIHRDGIVLDVNQATTRLTGYDQGELIGHEIWKLGPPASQELVRDRLRTASEGAYEVTMTRKDGTSFLAEVDVRNATYQGRPVRVAAVRDVTERHRREQEILAAKQKAEEAARLKSSLLTNMSHELRTPLTGILGLADLIASEEHPTFLEYGRLIAQSGERLLRTISDVLEMAEIEGGMLPLPAADVDVCALVEEVAAEVRPALAHKAVALHLRRPEAAGLYTSRAALRRVVQALLHNAVKFTEEGEITVTVRPEAAGCRLAVQDTGIGIDPVAQAHVFEAFRQGSNGLDRRHEGSGLGLTIALRLVEGLGGTLTMESAPGAGSTFEVFLPHAPRAQEIAPAAV